MKYVALDVVPILPCFFPVSFYDTDKVNFLLVCFNTNKCVQKTQQVYDPETQIIHEANFFRLNDNDLYTYNMDTVDLKECVTISSMDM